MQLRSYQFFKDLTEVEISRLERDAVPMRASIGTILYYQDDVNDAILFLRSGRVKVYLQPESISQSEVTLYEVTPGEQCLVNTISTLSRSKTLASAVAVESVEGWMIPRETLLWLVDHSAAYRAFKLSLCHERLSALMGLIQSIKFEQLDQRILNWLYVQGQDVVYTTHANMATLMGVTREAVSRNLKKLEHGGLIRLGRGNITLLHAS